jgi:NADH-quinone oxidoreductase subunit L
MGGLAKKMPVTHFAFLVGCLSISGIPFFSGFYSKEEILLAAFHRDRLVYIISLLTSGLTAFYMFRLYFLVFWNRPYEATDKHDAHGEGGWAMMLPLVLLSIGSLLGGYVHFGDYVSSDGKPLAAHFDISFSILPVTLALTGIGAAYAMYFRQRALPDRIAGKLNGAYTLARNKFYVDEAYLFITRKVLLAGVAQAAAWVDKNIIDEIVHSVGESMQWFSERIKKLQSGSVQQYALFFLAGLLCILIGLLSLR